MSGECDKCDEHALDCKCNAIISPSKHIKTSIDKEYFRNEFKKVFNKWGYKLGTGMDMYDEEEFFNDLINIM